MAESLKLFPLRGQAGVKRDGTDTEGNYWSDPLWTRFYRSLPRSMPGYRSMSEELSGPSRGLFVNPNGAGFIDIFNGSSDKLEVAQFTQAGVGSTQSDITPVGFTASPSNVWQMDRLFNSNGGGAVSIIAHAAPNLAAIDSNITRPVYIGDINAAIPLTPCVITGGVTPYEVDGGILALPPYLVAYGSNGLFAWTAAGIPASFPVANAANICGTKIVKGFSIRGGANSPSALLWSLDSVIQASFVGGSTIWNFNTLSDQSSILSSSAVVEMDGVYYWPGIDRWLVFNGVLRELPNEMNLDFFLTNLNFAQRQKVFGFKIPRWGEICWCAPMFGSEECNWMFIYNVRGNTWYDTPLPLDGRSAAFFPETWQYPVMGSALGVDNGTVFPLWQHEFGYDQVRGNQVDAIPSSITTPALSIVGGGLNLLDSAAAASQSVFTQIVRLEQDFIFGPHLDISLLGREFPQDDDVVLNTQTITKLARNNAYTMEKQQRYLRWKIGSNVGGGFFIMGEPLISFRPGDSSP